MTCTPQKCATNPRTNPAPTLHPHSGRGIAPAVNSAPAEGFPVRKNPGTQECDLGFERVEGRPGAYSIAPQTTANLQLVWIGVQAIEQIHLKLTANFHLKQWRLTFDGSVSFGWVQTRPKICGAIEYAPVFN